jgi:hypothetical protein
VGVSGFKCADMSWGVHDRYDLLETPPRLRLRTMILVGTDICDLRQKERSFRLGNSIASVASEVEQVTSALAACPFLHLCVGRLGSRSGAEVKLAHQQGCSWA